MPYDSCRRWAGHISTLVLVVACLSLVGCSQPIAGSGTTTPNPTAGLIHCGSVSQSAAGVTPEHPETVEHCFLAAYQACRPATLEYSWAGVDTSTDHLFATRSADGPCEVTDTAREHGCCSSVPQSGTTTYTCAGVASADRRVTVLACGTEGDIQLP
jgi:hypothetical protein